MSFAEVPRGQLRILPCLSGECPEVSCGACTCGGHWIQGLAAGFLAGLVVGFLSCVLRRDSKVQVVAGGAAVSRGRRVALEDYAGAITR